MSIRLVTGGSARASERWKFPNYLSQPMSPNITTNGKLDPSRAKTVIAAGGVALAFQAHTEKAPRWMKLLWQKITQKQNLATKKRECVGFGNSGGMRS